MQDIIHNIANYLHILAALALLIKIWCTQNCAGISGKTQLLYTVVFITRYLDLFSVYISAQYAFMKVLYIILGFCTVLSIYFFHYKTYERKYDTFRIEILLLPCLGIACFMNYRFNLKEVMWAFSIYLEAVAILPQFHFVAKAKYLHKHVFYYILALGVYKCMYIVHWIYRYYNHDGYNKITAPAGVVQCLLYCDFFARVVPYLNRREQSQDTTIDFTPTTMEDGVLNQGHLKCNVSTIVLTPASLLTVNSDKDQLLKSEDPPATTKE